MPDNELRWFEVSLNNATEAQRQLIPRYARQACIDGDGVVYVSAWLTNSSEVQVMLCAGYDGVPMIADGKHGYYPAQWIAREFPEAREAAEAADRRLKRECGKPEGPHA